jgi:hypothetical protein
MQQSEEFQLFVKGTYNGESKASETVFKYKKDNKVSSKDATTYIDLLASIYNTAVSRDTISSLFQAQMARIGAAVLNGESEENKRGYIILLPPFLANQVSFENNFNTVIFETSRPKFQHAMYLLNQIPIDGFVSNNLKVSYANRFTFIANLTRNMTAETASWRLLYWGCAANSFQKTSDMIDENLLTENSVYYILANILASYNSVLPAFRNVTPKVASNREINDLKLRPAHSHYGQKFKALYVEPIPISNQMMTIFESYPQGAKGTTVLDPNNMDKREILLNQKCSLGRCEATPEIHARGLLLKPEEVKKSAPVTNFDLNCADYTRFELDDYAKQLSMQTDKQESDTILCQRIKGALKKRFA